MTSKSLVDCPAAKLAVEAADLADAHRRADAARQDWKMEAIEERIAAVEEAATWADARSPLGVFYQAVLIFARTDQQSVWIADGPAAAREARGVRRLAAAIVGYAEAEADASIVVRLRAYYMNRDEEPAAIIAQALAA